ncbi:hypothetical protein EDB89DRAFT_2226243 [Lactarius sanguifluus]|nr:hypothetical protein EDB89DRAFT_2226243 [Lactarius sanguifluus]
MSSTRFPRLLENGECVGLAFPPANVMFSGIGILLAAAKDVRASHDALVDLFGRIEGFFKCLKVYTETSSATGFAEVLVNVVVEVPNILSIATKEMGQSRATLIFCSETFLKKLVGIEDALKRYNLIREEHQAATAQVLKSTSELKNDTKKANMTMQQIVNDVGEVKSGAGKSILCSAIVQHIMALRDARVVNLAYFYFDFRDEDKQNVRNLLTSLLVQLSAYSNSCRNIIPRLYSEHGNGTQQPSDDALTSSFKEALVAAEHPTYIIMDALDECPDISGMPTPREVVLDFVEDLVGQCLPSICVTSRPEIDIKTALKPLAIDS